jgi:hypothetical protein
MKLVNKFKVGDEVFDITLLEERFENGRIGVRVRFKDLPLIDLQDVALNYTGNVFEAYCNDELVVRYGNCSISNLSRIGGGVQPLSTEIRLDANSDSGITITDF